MFTTRNLLMLIGRHTLITLSAVGIAAIVCFIIARGITNVSDDITKNRRLATNLERRTDLFSTIARDAETIGDNDARIESAFVPADSIFEFISILESIALKNTVTQSFRFDNPSPSPYASPFPISTIAYSNTLSLNVFTLINYLKDFERLPYFTKIESVSITSQDPAGWRGSGSASFRATLYAKTAQ